LRHKWILKPREIEKINVRYAIMKTFKVYIKIPARLIEAENQDEAEQFYHDNLDLSNAEIISEEIEDE
jgi:hypothetical protein